jgi:diguanylate cyclase (GGDEF)-like protein
MGGDEFVLVLPGLDAPAAAGHTERLRRAVAEAAWRTANGCRLEMSVGVSHFPTDGSDAEELLAEADRRMYGAKQTARLKRPNAEEQRPAAWGKTSQSVQ